MKHMRFKVFSLCMVFSLAIYAQQNLKELTVSQIPVEMKIKGNFVSAVSYSDSIGINYIIQTETKLFTPKSAIEAAKKYELINVGGRIDTIRNIEADYRIKGLNVYHYFQKGDSVSLLWKHLDKITDCSYKNIKAEYLTKPLVTDLDNNGKCEVWLLYQLGCRESEDVGLGMKLVMYKGKDSYVVRGIRQTKLAKESAKSDSTVKADDSFKELPQAMRDYSFNLWNSYKKEN